MEHTVGGVGLKVQLISATISPTANQHCKAVSLDKVKLCLKDAAQGERGQKGSV